MISDDTTGSTTDHDLHRSSDGGYRFQFDPAAHVEVSTAICTVVAEISDVDPMSLEPLHHTIDPDALNALFKFSAPGYSGRDGYVHFTFAGHEITVFANGTVEIVPLSPDR